ncbi:glycosyltransferase [Microbacterium sp. HD4P20]|uniref:glycosyltransferase n=1 Tax=Microbacterium sp. HD4P20 TaxID=2864874 RepID=UPI001C63B89B|nr:glycosyltransferase [Microbacterium sp. HD4P20]MCP2636085.1 glycosyltransferase [Microbacterium sp. HD4P20]
MKVLIFTFGTRGDVDPYAALADRLALAGHEAVLAAPEAYRDTLAPGVSFDPIATEMDAVMRAGMAGLSGPAQALTMARRMSAAMRVSLEEQWAVAQRVEPTVIVSHPKALAGFHIAERQNVPFVASLPLPFLTPTADFPVPFLPRPLPGDLNRLTYEFNRFTAMAYGGMINRFRRERLGLGRMSRVSDYLHGPDGARVPVLYPFSRHVVPVPPDYPATAHVTGYWFRERAEVWHPPAELEAFLAGGRPAVYVGFGSMGFGAKATERGRVVLGALREAGVRAVVARGWGALEADSSEDVMVVDHVPHDWLFPRVSAVVHHGGSGTTAAGLRAGRPTLICPVLGDQPFWGRRVHELGAGPQPLPLRRARVPSLAERIRDLVGDPAYAAAAARVAEGIAAEDGTGRAVAVLEQIAAAHSPTRREHGAA